MKKQLVLLLFLTIFFTQHSAAAESEHKYYYDLALQGNEQYTAGNYDSAITLYSQVVNASISSANLFYNLGNSYFKVNELAPSIYYLEKAQKLAPFDKDISFNLEMAKDQIPDRIKDVPTPILAKSWSFIRNLLTIDGWGIFGTISSNRILSSIHQCFIKKIVIFSFNGFFTCNDFILNTWF